MPTTATQIREEFNAVVREEGLITNTSDMSPFWRLLTAMIITPVLWLKNALISTVMSNLFLATAKGAFLDLFAWAVNLARKSATSAAGVVRFTKTETDREITVPLGTVIQTERINGIIYRLIVSSDVTLSAGIASASIPVVAELPGSGFNLAPGYFRILPVAIDGIASAETENDWLTVPGADEELDDDLRDRIKNQYNLVGQYHTDAVYRGMIASIAGLNTDRIYFQYDAPRGPGTVNVYLLLDSGTASQQFIDTVNDYVMTQGNHGHGDDVLCLGMPETLHDLTVAVYLESASNLTDEQSATLLGNIGNMIRCAFRENTDYDVAKTWPYSRFSVSRLGEEIHTAFSDVQSLEFSIGDIVSDLNVPRLNSLTVVSANG
ncbi:hypothetical protein AV903_03240 [Erwinia tracheiphila]|uniref:Baseplate protein J-like barrel domain-containing protein n=2 Tax=Erwinia tracheiphila TaxID=65700 RepID=A0A345CZ32_9GAMM|nr:hypothetical protein AV903_03240 [Erwinia tracheiphila]